MKYLRRIIVTVMGGTVLAIGFALLLLPGPALIVIPIGLAILALEFAWARRWLRSVRALLPRPSNSDFPNAKKKMITLHSVRRSLAFLFRRLRRTFLPKRKLV